MAPHGDSVYELELEACFLFTIETSVKGRPQLTQRQLEEMIDEHWWWISADTDVLLESHWELVDFRERPADAQNH
jgi:hypothetical protein